MKPEEQRIYVAVAGTIQVPASAMYHKTPDGKTVGIPTINGKLKTVVQPAGRQIAQACHVVSRLRFTALKVAILNPTPVTAKTLIDMEFEPVTTIILQARDSAEMGHVFFLLAKRKLNPVIFSDNNPEYGPGDWPTAIAVFATKKQIQGILDYLPLWSGL